MGKLYAGARALAVLVAIVAAFATIPQVAVILLALGIVSGIGNGAEDNMRVFLIATVLTVCSKLFDPVPTAGPYLVTIFTGLGTAAFGSAVSGILIGLYRRTVGELTAKPAA
jgi:hypothetical protein